MYYVCVYCYIVLTKLQRDYEETLCTPFQAAARGK